MSLQTTLQRLGVSLVGLLGAASSIYAAAPLSQLPPERTQGSLSFVSGGVSDEEAKRFETAFHRYPLVIQLFEHAGPRNEYTADAQVRISDRQGHVLLDQTASGPFMLVNLPAGDYRVAASLRGTALPERSVHVNDGGSVRSVFVFPADAG